MKDEPTELSPEERVELNTAEGTLSRYTCPECAGAIWEIQDGEILSYRCRVGHAHGEETFVAEKDNAVEAALWAAVTALEERADFARRLADRFRGQGNDLTVQRYERQAVDTLDQAATVRRAISHLRAPASEERAV